MQTALSGRVREVRETAILIRIEMFDHWFPTSVMECDEYDDLTAIDPGEEIEFLIPTSMADEKGLT